MRHIPICALAVALAPLVARADIVNIVANHDNTLYEDPAGSLSNGAGVFMFAGASSGHGLRRALMSFDVAGSIPAGSTITGVSLRLQMTKTIAGDVPMGVYALTNSWGEGASNPGTPGGGGAQAAAGDATWMHRFYSTTTWSTPGGDFDPTALSTLSIGGNGSYTWASTPQLVALAQAWLSSPAGNFGVLIRALDESVTTTAKRFATRENSNASFRPTLVVTYTPVPGPGTAAPLALAAFLGARRRR